MNPLINTVLFAGIALGYSVIKGPVWFRGWKGYVLPVAATTTVFAIFFFSLEI